LGTWYFQLPPAQKYQGTIIEWHITAVSVFAKWNQPQPLRPINILPASIQHLTLPGTSEQQEAHNALQFTVLA
jgi:hypothetical protein